MAETRPTGIRIGIGLQRHGGGGMAVRTITCIPGVTGDWRYAGGGVSYDTRGFYGLTGPPCGATTSGRARRASCT